MKPLLLLAVLCAFLFGCRTNESPKAQVDDLQIAAKMKSKMLTDIGVSSVTDISINSTNGVVTLSGQVDSAAVRDKAEAIAKAVPNVVRVVNNIQVAPKPQPGSTGQVLTRPFGPYRFGLVDRAAFVAAVA
jgi:hypothetical protein